MSDEVIDTPAVTAARLSGVEFTVSKHGPVNSVAEAAIARGVEVADVIKTIVVRRGEDDFVFILVPGDRVISWPKLRALLGVNRMSLPDAAEAKNVTGYERGTITPFGSTTAWPVIADERIVGRTVALGGGAHGVSLRIAADDVISTFAAQVADVTDPEPVREAK
jgi:Cys-tRNA(Pro) deacylase